MFGRVVLHGFNLLRQRLGDRDPSPPRSSAGWRSRRGGRKGRLGVGHHASGGVESLIGHPVSQTHAAVPAPMRQAMGLTDSLVRLSCGVEDADDLIEDLAQAIG